MRAREKNSIFTRRGYALPAVLLFLAVSFGMWAVLYRTSGSMIRVEQARVLRASRTEWSAPAVATGLRLLQTGVAEGEFYECKLPITREVVVCAAVRKGVGESVERTLRILRSRCGLSGVSGHVLDAIRLQSWHESIRSCGAESCVCAECEMGGRGAAVWRD